MGTVGAASASADDVQLEAKRKEDSSWHPCQVSLSSDASTSFGLIVDIERQSYEEVIFTKEEALARLRVRSTPLQGDDCSQIKEGEHVLASQETKFGILFFDAKVEKVCRVRHSKRSQCRCSFEIKWLYLHPGARSVTVPASSIMKLATNTIDSHTTVLDFLNSIESFDCTGVSSIVSLLEESVFGSDLEKQIEEISRLADVGEKGKAEGCPELEKVDLTAQVRHRTIASQVSFLQDEGPREQNNSRMGTRGRKKIQEESKKVEPPPQLVTEESDRIYLSPLAARAALASLMYKLPTQSELSAYDAEREVLTNISQSTPMNSFMKDVLFSSEDYEVSVSPKHSRRETSNNDKVKRSSSCSPTDTNSDGPTKTSTRFTRSAIQKGGGLSNGEIHTSTPRFTRSIIQKETRNVTVEVHEVLHESKLAQDTRSGSTKETRRKKPVPSLSNNETSFSVSRESQKKQRVSNDAQVTSEGEISVDKKSESSKTKPKLRFSPRLTPRTRSSS